MGRQKKLRSLRPNDRLKQIHASEPTSTDSPLQPGRKSTQGEQNLKGPLGARAFLRIHTTAIVPLNAPSNAREPPRLRIKVIPSSHQSWFSAEKTNFDAKEVQIWRGIKGTESRAKRDQASITIRKEILRAANHPQGTAAPRRANMPSDFSSTRPHTKRNYRKV